MRSCRLMSLLLVFAVGLVTSNRPPQLLSDMNNLVLSEATPPGSVVYQLEAKDPEDDPVRYGLIGAPQLSADATTGEVRLIAPLDREMNDTLRATVTVEDSSGAVDGNNVVRVPVTVIVLDENDSPPIFLGAPYTAEIGESASLGSVVVSDIRAEDPDILGDTLELMCEELPQFAGACSQFEIAVESTSPRSLTASLLLRRRLDYAERQQHQLRLVVTDGTHNSSTAVEVRVRDEQNRPPVFEGSLAGVVDEDAEIGTLVLTVHARDGDTGQPRRIAYELLTNPEDYFLLDPESGELRTAKPLDKEALPDSTGVINLSIRAREVTDDSPEVEDPLSSSTAQATVTVRDVNDEAPRFDRREYRVSLPENTPPGSPLPGLDMRVTDPDVGTNSAFSLRLEDVSGAFAVEPGNAVGSTSVTVRVANTTLDYEDPNQRKFILLVVAQETQTQRRLSSTATVAVTVEDANDNAPVFAQDAYEARVAEEAGPGTLVAAVTASDRDSGSFGDNGLVYTLLGDGADRFAVDPKTGVITVAECNGGKMGQPPCLDFETRPIYFLSYKVTDDEGAGQSAVVPLKIALTDSNDNAPHFLQPSYRAAIDEGATSFEPPLFVQAEDADRSSVLKYSLVAGDPQHRFTLDASTGELRLANNASLDGGELIVLSVQASDGRHAAAAEISVSVRDVNNNAPIFEKDSYTASMPEDSEIDSLVEQVRASDGDAGDNARISYLVQRGAFDHFKVEAESGVVRVAARLDYDRRPQYVIEILAVDAGTPALTGTTTLTVNVLNSNDKPPVFIPPTQRAEISEGAAPGSVVHTLAAHDPDVAGPEALQFNLIADAISAVDSAGKLVNNSDAMKGWFTVDRSSGNVSVARTLSRSLAAVVRLPVTVTDISATIPQLGNGTLVITIVGVNGRAPEFASPWRAEHPHLTVKLAEEAPLGSLVGSFEATDPDSASVARYEIDPPSEYFSIDNDTGVVRTKLRVDFEQTPQLNFTVVAWDSGQPPLSASAVVTVQLVNLNDEDPVFSQPRYEATVKENAPRGTPVTKVHASDKDSGEFGRISYSLVGEHAADFSVDVDGAVYVHNPGALDRETTPEIVVQAVASDGAKPPHQRTVAVPVHIKIEDVNEHAPKFAQRSWRASLVEDVTPGSPLLQLRAEDADPTANLTYAIESGDPEGVFRVDPVTGVVYANSSLRGSARDFELGVTVSDGLHVDRAELRLGVLAVNQHKPEFILPELSNATVEVPENAGLPNYLVMTVKATDKDAGDNGHVSYHLKSRGGTLVQETDEFTIDPDTGELRTKVILDRERRPKYELVLVARDRGSPVPYETLRFLTVLLVDANDNEPRFPVAVPGQIPIYRFRVTENSPADLVVGTVRAEDQDEGAHAQVFYVLVSGGAGRFTIGRNDGKIRAMVSLDREQQETYELIVKATNDPDYNAAKAERELVLGGEEALLLRGDTSVARVVVTVADENDNAPKFEQREYYAGVSAQAGEGEPVAVVTAVDPDKAANGSLEYLLRASNLFPPGATVSAGSLIPSPFRVGPEGRLVTAAPMAEHDQGRFQLKLVARETASPYREAEVTIHVWVYAPGQLVRVIVSRPPERVHAERAEVAAELATVTGGLVVLDDLRYHVDDRGRLRHDWSDMYLHVVDKASFSILPVPDVLRLVDANYDTLRDYYAGFAIENVVPAMASRAQEDDDRVDPALAALVALLVVLGVGFVSFLVVCCCLRHCHWIAYKVYNWVMPMPGSSNSSELKRKEALIKQEMAEELACTTENPLWIEQKLKLYEEQELTMQVFSEPDQAAAMDDSSDPPLLDFHSQADAQSNMYATLQPPPRHHTGPRIGLGHSPGESSDYATLSRPTPGYAEVPEVREVMAGFHGSTFQPPRSAFDPDM